MPDNQGTHLDGGSGPSAKAYLVTVGIGAEQRQYKGCLIEIIPALGVVNIWRDEPRRHIATAPLTATLIEWEAPSNSVEVDDSIW
jgi:hypothetical protein